MAARHSQADASQTPDKEAALMSERLVEKLSKRGCLTISQEVNIGDLSRFLTKHKIGATPVTDAAGKLVGII